MFFFLAPVLPRPARYWCWKFPAWNFLGEELGALSPQLPTVFSLPPHAPNHHHERFSSKAKNDSLSFPVHSLPQMLEKEFEHFRKPRWWVYIQWEGRGPPLGMRIGCLDTWLIVPHCKLAGDKCLWTNCPGRGGGRSVGQQWWEECWWRASWGWTSTVGQLRLRGRGEVGVAMWLQPIILDPYLFPNYEDSVGYKTTAVGFLFHCYWITKEKNYYSFMNMYIMSTNVLKLSLWGSFTSIDINILIFKRDICLLLFLTYLLLLYIVTVIVICLLLF